MARRKEEVAYRATATAKSIRKLVTAKEFNAHAWLAGMGGWAINLTTLNGSYVCIEAGSAEEILSMLNRLKVQKGVVPIEDQ